MESQTKRLAPLILLVDDTPDFVDAWQLLLELYGFRVVTAIDGASGLAQAQKYLPDLILTDYMMPGMDGLTMCRKMKADTRFQTVPIIMWTGAVGCITDKVLDRLLCKPVRLELLIAEIAELLPGHDIPTA